MRKYKVKKQFKTNRFYNQHGCSEDATTPRIHESHLKGFDSRNHNLTQGFRNTYKNSVVNIVVCCTKLGPTATTLQKY